MKRTKFPSRSVKKTILTFDICSSSNIIEDLKMTENTGIWKDLLVLLEKYLAKRTEEYGFILYKFTGDGWIILFKYDLSGEELFEFLRGLSIFFNKRMKTISRKYLETTPDILGLTFGLDRGTLIKFKLSGRLEYIGRAINVACRLQGSIRDDDGKPQYKVLMTKSVYNQIKEDISDLQPKNAQRTLRNIAGDKAINCMKVSIPLKK